MKKKILWMVMGALILAVIVTGWIYTVKFATAQTICVPNAGDCRTCIRCNGSDNGTVAWQCTPYSGDGGGESGWTASSFSGWGHNCDDVQLRMDCR